MAFTENIKLVVDVVTGNAQSAMGKIKTDVADAEGAFGKLKAGAGGAFTAIGAMGPQIVAGAGAAIGAFAVKGVQDFQNIALAAGKFADSSGLAVEDASKWLEVADHIGVSEQAVSSAFRRMGVAIGNNSAGWRELGVETQKNADGSVNLSETFLKVVTALQKIEDPTKRAAAAQKLFGKGYAEVAELIGRSAPELAGMLNEVGDAKIINEQELANAREFRGAMDDLGDATQELGMMIGQSLVPALSDAASMLAQVIAMADDLSAGFNKADEASGGWLGTLKDTAIEAINPIEGVRRKWDELFGSSDKAAEGVDKVTAAVLDGKDGAAGYATAHAQAIGAMSHFGATADSVAQQLDRNVTGMLNLGASADAVAQNVGNETAALLALNDALAANVNATLASFDSTFALSDAQRTFNAAAMEANSTTENQQVAFDDAAQAALRVASATVTYAEDQATLKGETLSAKDSQQILISTLSQLAAQIGGPVASQLNNMVGQLQTVGAQKPKPTVSVDDQATAPLASIKGKVDGLDAARASVTVNADGNANSQLQGVIDKISRINNMRIGVSTSIPGLAGGTTRFGGGLAMVGEQGPELVHLPPGTAVDNAAKTQSVMSSPRGLNGGGGSPTVIHFHGPVLGDKATIGRYMDEAIAEARRRGNRAS